MQIHPFFKKVLFGLTLFVAARSQASVIFSYTNLVATNSIPSSPTFSYSFGINIGPNVPPDVGPWDIPLLTINSFSNESAWGQTFVLNAGNNPNFDAFVAQITNGTPDILGLSLVPTTASGYLYQYFFEPSYFFPGGGPGVDLKGNTITQIEISFTEDRTLEEFFMPDFETKYTVTFLDDPIAAVPETSSTLFLLGVAVIPALFWQFRRTRMLQPQPFRGIR